MLVANTLGYAAPRGRLIVTSVRQPAALLLGCALLVAVVFATSAEAAEPQPMLTSVSIDSDSATTSDANETATVGDTVTLTFTADETIQVPTVE